MNRKVNSDSSLKLTKSRKKKLKSNSSSIVIDLTYCRYRVVQIASKSLHWQQVVSKRVNSVNNPDWDLIWIESGKNIENFVKNANFYQKVNHFPGKTACK
jgi:hypothetical protein